MSHRILPSFVLVLCLNAFNAAAQCPNIPDGGGETVDGYMQRVGSCTVPPGSYVRTLVPYRIDVHATTGGTCTVRVYDPQIPGCRVTTIQNRGVASMRVDIISGPSGPAYPYSVPPVMYAIDGSGQQTNQDQDVDSCVPGSVLNDAVPNWMPIYTGQTTLRFKSAIYLTSCLMTPLEAVKNMSVNVLKCQPLFLDTNGHIRRLKPGVVRVFLDQSTMSGATAALDAAIGNLNSNQSAGTGVTFQRIDTPCPTPYDGTCIPIQIYDQEHCGVAGAPSTDIDPNTGYYTGELFLRLRPDWATYSATGLWRTFVHELEHFMGLDNYTAAGNCSVSDAVMRPDFFCAQTVTLTTLTINDYLPVLRTAYGSDPRTTCGW